MRAAVPADAKFYATYGRFNNFLMALTSDPDEPPNEAYPEPFQFILQCADALGVETPEVKPKLPEVKLEQSMPELPSMGRNLRVRGDSSAARSGSGASSSSSRLKPKPEPKPGTPPGFDYMYLVGDVCKNTSDHNRTVEIIEVCACMCTCH